jgi:hypothetical protein
MAHGHSPSQSKKCNVVCVTRTTKQLFNIYNGYKLALSTYRRRNFDPFRRRLRIRYAMDGASHSTTVGQANFLSWAYDNGVLDYAEANYDEIEADMNQVTSQPKGIVKKRRELSKTPSNKCFVYRETAPRMRITS